MVAPNFVVKKSLTGTLLKMNVKEVIEISFKDFKENSVRNAANKLKSKGCLYSVSSAGRINTMAVMRLK